MNLPSTIGRLSSLKTLAILTASMKRLDETKRARASLADNVGPVTGDVTALLERKKNNRNSKFRQLSFGFYNLLLFARNFGQFQAG